MAESDPDSTGKGGRRSSLINENEGHQVHATIDLSPFSNATFHHLYPQHFPSYETNSAYGYYAPNSTNVFHPASEGWTEYLSRINKQTTASYPTTQTEGHGTTYEDTTYIPARSVDSYMQPLSYTQTSQQYSSQPTSEYAEDGQYYSYTNRNHTSSYGLPSYPQHFLQPLDPYAQIFPPSVVSGSEAKLKEPKPIPEDTAYSPGLYRVTDSFSQLSFPETAPSTQQNGTFQPPATIPQAAPAAPVSVSVPVPEPETSTYSEPIVETKKPRSYADALTRPRTAPKPVVPVPRPRPAGVPSTKPKNGATSPSTTKAPKKNTGTTRAPTRNGAPSQQSGFKQTQNTNPVQVRRRPPNPLAKKLDVNPENFDTNISFARFFVIKSYSADDVHKSIKYGVWTSTKHGNKRLDQAFTESHNKGPIFLFFSVNGSGCFCGMAEMTSNLDYDKTFSAWSQDDKWSGQFMVKWIYIKNIPNKRLRHIRLVNNNNKSVTNSRDTQEVFLEPGRQVLKVFHSFEHSFSILDDFEHFDRLEDAKKPKTTTTTTTTSTSTTTTAETTGPASSEVINTAEEEFITDGDVAPTSPTTEKKSESSSSGSTRGRGGFRRGGGQSGLRKDGGKDGGRSTYVPRGGGRGGRGGATFAVKAKPKPTSLPQ